MSRRKTYAQLQVAINGRCVGIFHKGTGGNTTFEYRKEWLEWNQAFPLSLSLPLQTDTFRGQVVINYFNNLLPDSEPVLKQIAERVGANGTDAYSLLSEIGNDCVGALQIVPSGQVVPPIPTPEGEILSEKKIVNILDSLGQMPLGINVKGDFRISIAGAQEKAAFLWHEEKWQRPIGSTPTTHIFKPSLGKIRWESGDVDMTESVENEHYCLKLIEAFGIETARTSIGIFGEKPVLIVERFDRRPLSDGRILRLPQEDMCQALGVAPTQKYQTAKGPTLTDILSVLRASDTPYKDQQTVFQCNILFWLIGAIDGHAKNFSIFLGPKNQFRLTPIYDVISAQPAFDAKQIRHKDYRVAMSAGKNNHYRIDKIHGRHFVESAVSAGLSEDFAREAVQAVKNRFDTAFAAATTHLPKDFPIHIHDSIERAARERLPLLESAFE